MRIREGVNTSILKCFQNVTHYTYIEDTVFEWEIDCEGEALSTQSNTPIYFVLDTINHHAFAHWVFEDLIFLEYYSELLKIYPTCKLVIEQEKDYKKLFFKYFSIPYENVILRCEMEEVNFCFFHKYVSLNNKSHSSFFLERVEKLKEEFDTIQLEKDIPILYLPRGTKENLQGTNNRVYDIQDELKTIVKSMGGLVYETDKSTQLEEQIKTVKRSSIILLDYGSNLWVNGMFAKNSHIVCLNIGWRQHTLYPSYLKLWEEVSRRNTITEFFSYGSNEKTEDGVAIIKFEKELIVNHLYNLRESIRI